MSYPVYYVPAGDVLPIFFDTFDGGTGASITMSGLAVTDIEIYKDGGATQRASDAGYTLLDTDGTDFDGTTGIHGFSIDTGDNTDSGFYTVGAWFHVIVSAVTVDGQTVNFIAAAFRIMAAEDAAGVPDVNVTHFGGTAGTFASGRPEVNTSHVAGTAQTAGDVIADTNDIQARLPAALVGGRIDASVGAMAAGVLTATAVATGAIDADALAADAVAEIADGVWDEASADHVGAGSVGERVERLDIIASGGAGGLTNARAALLDNLDAAVSTRATPAQVNTEVDTALADARLDELLAADSDIDGAAPPAVGSVFHELMTKTTGSFTFDQTTDSLEAVRDNMGTAQTGDSFARLGAPAGASVSADIASIKVDTDPLPTDPADQSLIIAATDAIMSRLGAPAGASVSADVAAVKAETASIQSDTNDIQTRLPAALTADGNIKADTLRISGSAESADRLERSTLGIATGTVGSASTTTSIVTSALSPAAAVTDQFKGRIVTFDKDTTTANLRGQSTDITASTAGGVLAVTALTTAPVSGDTFVVT